MDPVIGLDIAKGKSQVQAFLQKKDPYKKSFVFEHNVLGLHDFYQFWLEVEEITGRPPVVVFESTGHYHEPVLQFLEDHQIVYYLVNPVLSHEAKKMSLRKVKTDAIDAFRLGEMYYLYDDLQPFKKKTVKIMNLRNLTRQHDALTGTYVQVKLQFQTVLDQVFPEYKTVFGALYSPTSLRTLLHYQTPQGVKEETKEKIAEVILQQGVKRSYGWALDKAHQLKEAAERDPFRRNLYTSHVVSLTMFIQLLLQYQRHLSKLLKEIDALAEEFDEYEIIRSLPGIGGKIAATILSEIGEIDQFNHPKKLVAYAGMDPSVHESGQFKATINRITKRGSARLRQSLYNAVQCGITKNRNPKLRAYYDKKREEGKPHKVAIIACANKLIHWIYAILKSKKAYVV
ncbi:IS110 family transposase [Halobacillus naozhouensis]|uniref:IS110 family transposase n=3 Tax=Halobacillus naozhouensis TaxID=554880 RepID=A0ABY8J6B4_9BACI|nr:IS110 family transposase [Halobacillus naozhouensis]WFT74173.1 IS110 family transposase [Halobacillus naozhouensis]WFT76496.1 IS110 family transposase [Halobacillus naozhouensis]